MRVWAGVVLRWVTFWEDPVLHLFLLIRIFFAEFFASGGPTRSLCMHPFLFLRIFFTGLVVYVGPARLFFWPSLPQAVRNTSR